MNPTSSKERALLTERGRMDLANQVFKAVVAATESFESEDHIGADLAYLMGAIVEAESAGGFVDWSTAVMDQPPALHRILAEAFPKGHPVWLFIEL